MEDVGGEDKDGHRDSIVAHAEGDYSIAANSIRTETHVPTWLFWAILIGLDFLFFVIGMIIDANRLGGGW